MRFLCVSALVLAACGGSTSNSTPAPVVTATSASATASAPPPPAPAPEPAPSASATSATKSDGPFAALPPSLPTNLPRDAKPVKRSGKTWPYHAWDRAESVVMNWAPYGPDSEMRAHDDKGWTTRLAYRAPLDAELAKRSVDLAVKEGGELETTKCPIPRHAVVLFEGETPVASINVDLTCDNVLLWPRWSSTPPTMQAKVAKEFLPQWRSFFLDELHFPAWDRANGP